MSILLMLKVLVLELLYLAFDTIYDIQKRIRSWVSSKR